MNGKIVSLIYILFRRSHLNDLIGAATFGQLYSNLFTYPLYIGVCLLLMLVYSVIYLLLAIYIERINPGEFGVAQPWNYLFKRSYWKPQATAVVHPLNGNERPTITVNRVHIHNPWIEVNATTNMDNPSLTVSHLTKVNNRLFIFSL